jgi:Raf kinase inhibitor-like YbhB/YbcL family protein
MQLTSAAFSDGNEIPMRYTQDGGDVSPPLAWSGVPDGTKSFALIVDDPDAPDPAAPKRTWVHWVVSDLPPEDTKIDEGAPAMHGEVGKNDWNRARWNGPLPPKGRHRYIFKLYALDTLLQLDHPTKAAVEQAMKGHVLDEARLVGTYARHVH